MRTPVSRSSAAQQTDRQPSLDPDAEESSTVAYRARRTQYNERIIQEESRIGRAFMDKLLRDVGPDTPRTKYGMISTRLRKKTGLV